jgi:hypothetical protein
MANNAEINILSESFFNHYVNFLQANNLAGKFPFKTFQAFQGQFGDLDYSVPAPLEQYFPVVYPPQLIPQLENIPNAMNPSQSKKGYVQLVVDADMYKPEIIPYIASFIFLNEYIKDQYPQIVKDAQQSMNSKGEYEFENEETEKVMLSNFAIQTLDQFKDVLIKKSLPGSAINSMQEYQNGKHMFAYIYEDILGLGKLAISTPQLYIISQTYEDLVQYLIDNYVPAGEKDTFRTEILDNENIEALNALQSEVRDINDLLAIFIVKYSIPLGEIQIALWNRDLNLYVGKNIETASLLQTYITENVDYISLLVIKYGIPGLDARPLYDYLKNADLVQDQENVMVYILSNLPNDIDIVCFLAAKYNWPSEGVSFQSIRDTFAEIENEPKVWVKHKSESRRGQNMVGVENVDATLRNKANKLVQYLDPAQPTITDPYDLCVFLIIKYKYNFMGTITEGVPPDTFTYDFVEQSKKNMWIPKDQQLLVEESREIRKNPKYQGEFPGLVDDGQNQRQNQGQNQNQNQGQNQGQQRDPLQIIKNLFVKYGAEFDETQDANSQIDQLKNHLNQQGEVNDKQRLLNARQAYNQVNVGGKRRSRRKTKKAKKAIKKRRRTLKH